MINIAELNKWDAVNKLHLILESYRESSDEAIKEQKQKIQFTRAEVIGPGNPTFRQPLELMRKIWWQEMLKVQNAHLEELGEDKKACERAQIQLLMGNAEPARHILDRLIKWGVNSRDECVPVLDLPVHILKRIRRSINCEYANQIGHKEAPGC